MAGEKLPGLFRKMQEGLFSKEGALRLSKALIEADMGKKNALYKGLNSLENVNFAYCCCRQDFGPSGLDGAGLIRKKRGAALSWNLAVLIKILQILFGKWFTC